jgi:hypothetical protein
MFVCLTGLMDKMITRCTVFLMYKSGSGSGSWADDWKIDSFPEQIFHITLNDILKVHIYKFEFSRLFFSFLQTNQQDFGVSLSYTLNLNTNYITGDHGVALIRSKYL